MRGALCPVKRSTISPSGIRRLIFSLGLHALDTVVLLHGACLAQDLEHACLFLCSCDRTSLHTDLWLGYRDDLLQRVLCHILQLGLRCVAFLHTFLAGLLREDEKLRLVELQPLHISLQALCTAVSAAVVHCD